MTLRNESGGQLSRSAETARGGVFLTKVNRLVSMANLIGVRVVLNSGLQRYLGTC